MDISTRTKPLIFKKSKRLFKNRIPVNAFLELFIKVFFRNPVYWSSFLQLVSATGAAVIFIPPYWLKGAVFIGFILMLHSWLSMIWDRVTISHPLTKKYGEQQAFFSARKKAIHLLLSLGVLMVLAFYSLRLLFIN